MDVGFDIADKRMMVMYERSRTVMYEMFRTSKTFLRYL